MDNHKQAYIDAIHKLDALPDDSPDWDNLMVVLDYHWGKLTGDEQDHVRLILSQEAAQHQEGD